MGGLTAKDFAKDKVIEIIQLTDDLKFINNKELRQLALERLAKLAHGIMEHLEYLEIKE